MKTKSKLKWQKQGKRWIALAEMWEIREGLGYALINRDTDQVVFSAFTAQACKKEAQRRQDQMDSQSPDEYIKNLE